MKNIFLTLIFSTVLFAGSSYELKLYEKVLPYIFETPIKVYVDDDTKKLLQNSDKFEIVSTCSDAVVLLIGKNFEDLPLKCKEKPLFATSYRWYKNYENTLGAFYWRKGRPQLRFKKDTFKRHNINLPPSLIRYAR